MKSLKLLAVTVIMVVLLSAAGSRTVFASDGGGAVASVYPEYTGVLTPSHSSTAPLALQTGRSAEMFKVLSVLEKRVTDRELIDRVREKLPQVDSHKLHMLARLSDRMEDDRHHAGTNVAFLLIATLIVFS